MSRNKYTKESMGGEKTKKKNSGKIRNLYYDSLEELYFFHWCFELLDRGYIKDIQRSDPFHLSDKVQNNYSIQLKTKSKPATETLIEGHVYTPEAIITWSEKGVNKLVWSILSHNKRDKIFTGHRDDNGDIYSIVEVKPLFDYQNMQRLATLNIKWVYQKYGKLVDIVKCPILFQKTFTPKAYLTTPTGRKREKIKWNVVSVEQWINKEWTIKQFNSQKLNVHDRNATNYTTQKKGKNNNSQKSKPNTKGRETISAMEVQG